MTHEVLREFDRYSDWLDDKFDDALQITYQNFGQPTIKIRFCTEDGVNAEQVRAALPESWIALEKSQKVKLSIRAYDQEEIANSREAAQRAGSDELLEWLHSSN